MASWKDTARLTRGAAAADGAGERHRSVVLDVCFAHRQLALAKVVFKVVCKVVELVIGGVIIHGVVRFK